MWQNLKEFYKRNERHATSVAFALGFIWDNLTLTRVDLLYDNIVLTSYIVIAASGILLFHAYGAGRLRYRVMERINRWLPLIIQFAFGGLFSGYIVYYSRSGSLFESWPFLVFLLALFVGNELFKKRYAILTFQVSIFFIAIFSYFIFSVPVLLRSIGPWIFIASGIISLAIVGGLLYLLARIAPERFMQSRGMLIASILGIYALFNFAYFTNAIPPIPLALKDIGIYHELEKLPDGNYKLTYEPAPWYKLGQEISEVFHKESGKPLYVWSAIFAPSRLNTTVLHEWFSYDEKSERWISQGAVDFPITGGRGDGFRGYSYRTAVSPGKWRVDVMTKRRQIIGRIEFEVVPAEKTYKTKTSIR